MKQVVYLPRALKTLRRAPPPIAQRITDKIEQYAADPSSQKNNVKKLQGRDGYRLRVGDWRVVFNEDGVVVAVLDIGPRGNMYD